jgi:hypothetical protein
MVMLRGCIYFSHRFSITLPSSQDILSQYDRHIFLCYRTNHSDSTRHSLNPLLTLDELHVEYHIYSIHHEKYQ